jgi:hypothetical protein
MAKEYSKVAVSQALGVPRSSLYYRSQRETASELKRAIRDVCAEFPCYGYRRVTAELATNDQQPALVSTLSQPGRGAAHVSAR